MLSRVAVFFFRSFSSSLSHIRKVFHSSSDHLDTDLWIIFTLKCQVNNPNVLGRSCACQCLHHRQNIQLSSCIFGKKAFDSAMKKAVLMENE